MSPGLKVSCALCRRSTETETTGALLDKDELRAHQNCLLFSSGIFCQDSPALADLYGFSVEDVLNEVKRGKKLTCNFCKRKGATAGCEVKRCKKSYHYPCAVLEGAKTVEDKGKYELYCLKHQQPKKNDGPANGHGSPLAKPGTSKSASEAGPSKGYCLTCESAEGNTSLECSSHTVRMLYCDKHAPSSHKNAANGDSTAAGSSANNSDSNSSSCTRVGSSRQRRLSFPDRQEEPPSKHKRCNNTIDDDSSNPDEDEYNTEMEIFAPLESDLDENANSFQDHEIIREFENPAGSPSGNQLEDESEEENEDEDKTILHSDAESESLLLPVEICMGSESLVETTTEVFTQTASPVMVKKDDEGSNPERCPGNRLGQPAAEPYVPRRSSAAPSLSVEESKPRRVSGSPPRTTSAVSPAPPESTRAPSLSSPSPSPAAALPSDAETNMDSTGFWRSCNVAGCTQAIFADFINGMTNISSRIQSDQATPEEYDLALSVMAASGKLAEFVAKQQEELQRKQVELQKAAAAMNEVVSALRK
ncbi:uncharacterized protein phf11 [Embiotoca jacksoni]|uniref:uncharacterized protein phf11 n=1 Tax=Embiotoca jacksoni TaxID=100190 RepID=UPI0037046FAD